MQIYDIIRKHTSFSPILYLLFRKKKVSALFSSHSSHSFLGGVLATVLLLRLVEAIGEAELHASGVFPLLLLEPHVAVGAIGLSAYGVEDVVHIQTQRKAVFQETLVELEVEVVHAIDGDEIVGAAASVGEREVQIPALWKMEAVVETEDVVRVVEAFLLAHADGLDEALLDASLHLRLVETPAMAVAQEAAPVPAMNLIYKKVPRFSFI